MNCQEIARELYDLGMNDQEIADQCGISRVYLNYVKNGKRPGSDLLLSHLLAIYEERIPLDQTSLETVNDTPLDLSVLNNVKLQGTKPQTKHYEENEQSNQVVPAKSRKAYDLASTFQNAWHMSHRTFSKPSQPAPTKPLSNQPGTPKIDSNQSHQVSPARQVPDEPNIPYREYRNLP